MNVLLLILPLALFISIIFVWGFIKAVKTGQYDDLKTPAHRMLLDVKKVDNTLKKEEEENGIKA